MYIWESSRLNEIQMEIMKKLEYSVIHDDCHVLLCGEARYRLQNLESNVSITDGVVNREAISYFKFFPQRE